MATSLQRTKELFISDHEIERRKQYVGLSSKDLDFVKRVKDIVSRNADELTSQFFDHLLSFEEVKGKFSKSLLDQARRLKKEHLQALTSGEYERHYIDERIKLGSIYSQAGIDPKIFFGAFQHLIRCIGEKVTSEYKGDQKEAVQSFLALNRIAFLDLGIIVDVIIHDREQTILFQQEAIKELSTPVLQIRDRMLMLPIVGMIDTYRARTLTESLLNAIRAHRSKVVVMDITGVAAVDSKVANHIVQTVSACRLMGAKVIVTGLSSDIAQTIVTLGVDLSKLTTVGDLQGGVEEAERILGYKVLMDRSVADRSSEVLK